MLHLIEAQEKHSPLLQKFFQDQIVSGHVDYSIQRPHSFFDHYRTLSDDFTTVMLMDENQNVLGAASVTFLRGYVNRQEQMVGFLSDLRIAPQRIAIQQWSQEFIPLLYKRMEEKNCKFLFTAIEHYESQAYNALLRPRKIKRHLPHYYLYRKVNLYFFLGRWPWSPSPMPSIRIDHAWENNIEEICEYLMKKKVGGRIYFNTNPEALKRKFEKWPNFSIHNFLVARNYKNEIVGVMAPWNDRDVQQIVPRRYHNESRLLYESLHFTSLIRMSQYMPDENRAFSLRHITHCAVDNPEVFFSLLCQAYAETARGELLVHTNYFGDYATRPPLSFMSAKIPYGFYSVLSPEEDLPTFLKPNPFSPPPDFNFVHL